MASHVATLNPQVPAFALEKDSIILVDQDGLETVVGSSALQLSRTVVAFLVVDQQISIIGAHGSCRAIEVLVKVSTRFLLVYRSKQYVLEFPEMKLKCFA